MFRKLWKDDGGVVALEYLLLCVIIGLGMAVGYSAVSDALNAEYVELGQAILTLDDSYWINNQNCFGVQGFIGGKAGTLVFDRAGVEVYQHGPGVFMAGTTNFVNATP